MSLSGVLCTARRVHDVVLRVLLPFTVGLASGSLRLFPLVLVARYFPDIHPCFLFVLFCQGLVLISMVHPLTPTRCSTSMLEDCVSQWPLYVGTLLAHLA